VGEFADSVAIEALEVIIESWVLFVEIKWPEL